MRTSYEFKNKFAAAIARVVEREEAGFNLLQAESIAYKMVWAEKNLSELCLTNLINFAAKDQQIMCIGVAHGKNALCSNSE